MKQNNRLDKAGRIAAKALRLAVVFAVSLGAWAAQKDAPRNTARMKARYYYMEGQRHAAQGNDAEAYEYFRKAHNSDPAYEEAANAYGAKRLLIGIDTLQSAAEVGRSRELMRRFVDRYPSEVFEASIYAYVAVQTDTLPEAVRVLGRTARLNPGKTALLVHLSDTQLAAGQIDSALNALNTYERLEGRSPQLTVKKLTCLLALKDTVGAITEAQSLVGAFPHDAGCVMLKGNLYEALAMPDSALAAYRQAEMLEPGNGAVKMTLASWYKEHGDSTAYDNAIYDALLAEDFGAQEKVQVLSEYLQTLLNDRQDTRRGDNLFAALRRQYPHDADVLDLAARYSAAKGDWTDAIEEISYAIDQDPDNEVYRGQLMTYLLSDGRAAEAVETYRAASAHFDNPSESLQLLYASACAQNGDNTAARQVYADMIRRISPELYVDQGKVDNQKALRSLTYENLARLSTLYNMTGDSYYASGQKDKAFEAYENSLYFLPDNPMTLNNYAYFMTEEGGDLERAAEMSSKALAQVPDNDTYLDTYAWIEFKLGHYESARTYQEKAIDIAAANDVLSAELLEHYGDILFMCKEPTLALEYWKKALELDPANKMLKKKVEHKTYFYPETK